MVIRRGKGVKIGLPQENTYISTKMNIERLDILQKAGIRKGTHWGWKKKGLGNSGSSQLHCPEIGVFGEVKESWDAALMGARRKSLGGGSEGAQARGSRQGKRSAGFWASHYGEGTVCQGKKRNPTNKQRGTAKIQKKRD